MNQLLHRILPTLLLLLVLALPASRCHAQWKKNSDTLQIDTTTTADEYEKEYGTEEEIKTDEEDTATTETSITLYSRTIPPDTIAAYKRNASFAYMGYLDSLLRAEEKTRRNQPPPKEEVIDDRPSIWDSGIVKLICYIVAIGLVGFVIYKLVGQGLFLRNKRTTTAIPEIALDETMDESDLEKALRTAIAKKDYRLGVRYLFLMSLQRLGERGVLKLSSDKTNYQYATELSGKPYANRFAQLSLQYEYVWFGNFQISESQFSSIQQQHQQFVKEV